ncbi:MAG: hypothetical protein IJ682_11835 [Lachnospiraceae bacterium]|nr:hypothetical protein [Lachnospiraceae bacterium]
MDAQQEMYSLQEIFEVVKQLTGFSGDIMMQAVRDNRYVEQGGVEAILKHIQEGGRAETEIVKENLAEIFEKNLQNARVPYVGFEVTMESDEVLRLYTFRDKDRAIVKEVIKDMRLPELSELQVDMTDRKKVMDMEPGR